MIPTVATEEEIECRVVLRRLFAAQQKIRACRAKRIVIRGGRRGGKTTVLATLAVEQFLAGRRVLYATPTADQIERFWVEVKRALADPIEREIFYKNETLHVIEWPGTSARIRAKTAWNPDMLRGDSADDLMLDEWQLCDETMWSLVGAPMLLDNDGNAYFAYTPPSVEAMARSKARDPRHAAKMYKDAVNDTTGRWAAFTFTSHDNPYLSSTALDEITQDMTAIGYRQEILAEDIEEIPGALWTPALIEAGRLREPLSRVLERMIRVVVAVDPSGTKKGDEAGVIGVGVCERKHGYVLEDRSGQLSPNEWATAACEMYYDLKADCIVAEVNQGWDMVQTVIHGIDPEIPVVKVEASRGKHIRAQPIVALYQRGLVHHVGELGRLEKELTEWVPGESRWSPGRLDATVYGLRHLLIVDNRRGIRARSLR